MIYIPQRQRSIFKLFHLSFSSNIFQLLNIFHFCVTTTGKAYVIFFLHDFKLLQLACMYIVRIIGYNFSNMYLIQENAKKNYSKWWHSWGDRQKERKHWIQLEKGNRKTQTLSLLRFYMMSFDTRYLSCMEGVDIHKKYFDFSSIIYIPIIHWISIIKVIIKYFVFIFIWVVQFG